MKRLQTLAIVLAAVAVGASAAEGTEEDLAAIAADLETHSYIEELSAGTHEKWTRLEAAGDGEAVLTDRYLYTLRGDVMRRDETRTYAFALKDLDPATVRVEKQAWLTPGITYHVVIVETPLAVKRIRYDLRRTWTAQGEESVEKFQADVEGMALGYFPEDSQDAAERVAETLKRAIRAEGGSSVPQPEEPIGAPG
jgi:hypothetical protein